MKIVNNFNEIPYNYIRLNAEYISDNTKTITFDFGYNKKIDICKSSLIALQCGLFGRIYYINKYKLLKIS